jgi:hypothetical protein
MDQQQSLLFRLPRELREEVYYHYVWDENGYNHNPISATLQTSNNDAINLGLQLTCKRIAKEMEGLALRMNSINFRTLLSASDVTNEPSNAALFEQLLEDRGCRLRHMLTWAYTTVSVQTMKDLRSRYANSLAVQRMEKKVMDHGNTYLQDGYLPSVDTLDNHINESILQDVVQLIAASTSFDQLTSKEYELELRDSTRSIEDDDDDHHRHHYDDDDDDDCYYANYPPSYVAKTQRQILQWKPELWWIPDRTQLNAVLQFLPP